MISVEGLRVEFGGFTLFDDVSLWSIKKTGLHWLVRMVPENQQC